MIQILVWWLIVQVLGWAALPTVARFFRWLPDRGYAFSKTIGLLLVSYILWLGGSAGFLRNDLGGALFAILIVGATSVWFYLRRAGQAGSDLRVFLSENRKLVLTVEVLFVVAFVAWVGLRAYAPFKIEPAGGEKFMEIAFLNATLRSEQFPPLDPWLSGFAISYYYYGYVMMALLTRLSGAAAGVGFDLYDALLFALAVVGAFGVVYNLAAANLRQRSREGGGRPIAAGLLGSLLVTLMGNLEGFWEVLHARGALPESFWRWLDIPGLAEAPVTGNWYPGSIWLWWWRASRVVADRNLLGAPVGVQPIDEFPFFSFLLGDNHPHVLALPFVLAAIGLVFNLFLRQRENQAGNPVTGNVRWWNPVEYVLGNDWGLFIFAGVIFGALAFLNTWDMPIYLGLAVLAYGLGEILRQGRLNWQIIRQALVLGLGLGLACGVLYLFFYIGFDSQAEGILPYLQPPTRLPQYLTMFGTFIFLLICFLAISLGKQGKNAGGASLWKVALTWWLRILGVCAVLFVMAFLVVVMIAWGGQLAGIEMASNPLLRTLVSGLSLGEAFRTSLIARLRDPWVLLLGSGMLALVCANVKTLLGRDEPVEELEATERPATPSSDLFVFLLTFTGLALTMVVEYLYLHDHFDVRMNTVFKFYYQAWVMLGCAAAYGLWWLLGRLERMVARSAFLVGAVLLIVAGMVYPLMAIPSRAADFQGPASLDGASGVARSNPDDWAAIQWLNANIDASDFALDMPVLLEAPGGSYTYEGRISAFTGIPAVLGWAVHESQWRGNYDEQGRREPDIITIYTTSDGQLALELLRKWGVNYVIVGTPERAYIQRLCSDMNLNLNCTVSTALRKFELFFEPVFSQGQVVIYEVP